MNRILVTLPLLVPGLLGLGCGQGHAQALPDFTSSGADAALTRLFGEHKAFTAAAVLRVYDKGEQEILTASNTSSKMLGSGMIRNMRIATIATARKMSVRS